MNPNGRPLAALQPYDFPLPAWMVESFAYRITAPEDRSKAILRITPAAPMGNGQFGPLGDRHYDFHFSPENVVNLAQMLTAVMTEDQLAAFRAGLSDIQLVTKPKLEVARPGDPLPGADA